MHSTTINITQETTKKFSLVNLEKFVNSEDFEDLILGYQMLRGKTGYTQSFSSFKKDLGL